MNLQNGKKRQLYINGILYRSSFFACLESGISNVSVWKSFKKSGGTPVSVRHNFITSAEWIQTRAAFLKLEYGL